MTDERFMDLVLAASRRGLTHDEYREVFQALSEHRRAAAQATDLAVKYGGIDGAHHKTWVIDQMVRALAGDGYDALVAAACDGEDGSDTYEWDTGIAP